MTRCRDAYLEVWTDLGPRADLVADMELACWVGKVARALVWDRAWRAQGHDQAGECAGAPFENLATLATASWTDLRPEHMSG